MPSLNYSGKRTLRILIKILIIGFAVYVLIPQLAELPQGLSTLRNGNWVYLFIALIGSLLTFVAEVWMIRAAVAYPPGWIKATIVEIAGFFASTVTPAGLGWFAVNQRFLEHCGNDRERSRTALILIILLTLIADLILVAFILPLIPTLSIPTPNNPHPFIIMELIVLILVLTGLLVWIPVLRKKLIKEIIPVLNAFPRVFKEPKNSIMMILGAIASNAAYAIALAGSILAFEEEMPPFLGLLLANLVASITSRISPTPGGLGAYEMALVAILISFGMIPGSAAAAVLTFRFFTFWVPLPVGGWGLLLARKKGWIILKKVTVKKTDTYEA